MHTPHRCSEFEWDPFAGRFYCTECGIEEPGSMRNIDEGSDYSEPFPNDFELDKD